MIVNLGCQYQPSFGGRKCLVFLMLSLVVLLIETGFFQSKCEESKVYNGIWVMTLHLESMVDNSNNLRQCYCQMVASNFMATGLHGFKVPPLYILHSLVKWASDYCQMSFNLELGGPFAERKDPNSSAISLLQQQQTHIRGQ